MAAKRASKLKELKIETATKRHAEEFRSYVAFAATCLHVFLSALPSALHSHITTHAVNITVCMVHNWLLQKAINASVGAIGNATRAVNLTGSIAAFRLHHVASKTHLLWKMQQKDAEFKLHSFTLDIIAHLVCNDVSPLAATQMSQLLSADLDVEVTAQWHELTTLQNLQLPARLEDIQASMLTLHTSIECEAVLVTDAIFNNGH